MILPYCADKIFHAISGMASSAKSIQERTCDAWVGGLHVLQKSDFSGEELEKFVEIEREATSVEPYGNQGSFEASLLSMTDEAAANHAKKICTLYYMLLLEQPK